MSAARRKVEIARIELALSLVESDIAEASANNFNYDMRAGMGNNVEELSAYAMKLRWQLDKYKS